MKRGQINDIENKINRSNGMEMKGNRKIKDCFDILGQG